MILLLINNLVQALVFGMAIGTLISVLAVTLINFVVFIVWRSLKPWKGYNIDRLYYIVKFFAQDYRKVKLDINNPEFVAENDVLGTRPNLGTYDLSGTIYMDTRFLRSKRAIISTLLHEICHHNQAVQGRVHLGRHLKYHKQPIEIESNAFADAWFKKALEIYNKGPLVEEVSREYRAILNAVIDKIIKKNEDDNESN